MDQLKCKVESYNATPTTVSPNPLELLAHASTSPTTAKELQLQVALSTAMDQLKRVMGTACRGSKDLPELADAISSFAQVYNAANHLPHFPPAQRDRLVTAAEWVIKSGDPSHEGASVVWAGLHFYEGWALAYLQQCFPKSPFFFRVERLALYNLPKRLSKAITIGQQITITNPYMRMAKDSKPMIHVDNPMSIQLLEKVSICHFCSKQVLCCGKCRPSQCPLLQVSDWKELNHKAVCFAE
ncbi:uncharacterized protein ACA1_159670 [Acanthamoeba castellanii str. Neff]|uniref:Uncharacterized protein n=1 Tax=Acanthamoeba castellanii (strain ATCC 30010 / Neff) TaxID=1257118 RepID=L8H9G5_ACACF|nr:uncharacterized protein ACA1_159670 [Acanthamoeba castellanii str. Neff]ELR22129.1 hypothetical protein ACA1_159670 [Acanthamoeba castellanii str. Neff]